MFNSTVMNLKLFPRFPLNFFPLSSLSSTFSNASDIYNAFKVKVMAIVGRWLRGAKQDFHMPLSSENQYYSVYSAYIYP